MKQKSNSGLPTVEEFLSYRPIRSDFPWKTTEEGTVSITIPKFQGRVGQAFVKLLRKDNFFEAHLNPLGSFVWIQCDGRQTVGDILKKVQEKFPGEKEIDQRLFLFLQQMKALNYLTY
jgi:hypothetical protein